MLDKDFYLENKTKNIIRYKNPSKSRGYTTFKGVIYPKNKGFARQLGQYYYHTSVPCKNGHLDLRETATGVCLGCKPK